MTETLQSKQNTIKYEQSNFAKCTLAPLMFYSTLVTVLYPESKAVYDNYDFVNKEVVLLGIKVAVRAHHEAAFRRLLLGIFLTCMCY